VILIALLGLAAVLAYQALDAARAEARATQREMQGYAALASVQLARGIESSLAASTDSTASLVELARRAARERVPGIRLPVPRSDAGSAPLWVEVRAPDGSVVYGSGGWEPPAALRGSWLEAKVGWYEGGIPTGAVSDSLRGALAGFTTRVAVRPGALATGARGGSRGRLALLLSVFGLTLGLVGVAIVQLRRQQDLFRLRDDFVSGVSHELRTPLAQIRLFADLLDSGRLGDGEQRRRSIRVIAEESRRLSFLVENILHFSREQQGSLHVSAAPTDVVGSVREAADAFAPLAAASGARLVVDLEPDVQAHVDPDALRQILLNLLDNAVKYGAAGQRITLTARLRSGELHLWVDDEGPGVPPEERPQVWEPYRRFRRGSTAGGCGIGLSVVRDLVRLHGGRVAVDDAPSGGARFLCVFPGGFRAAPDYPPAAAIA
jgi:signal transduction histidine kinase